jgi:uncharacterized membrane-anchored protein YjiN (DUF445 family)
MTLAARPQDDAAREARLDTMRRRASGLLVVVAAVFVAARLLEGTHPWLGFVRATAEASLVGGLADWFAVTALFRRPLGLPIPHTAIVATQKDRIGRILGTFVERHFLAPSVVVAELDTLRLAERAAQWVAAPENSGRIAKQLVTGLAKTIEALPEAEFRTLIHDSAVARLQATRVAPVLGNVLALVTGDNRHHELLNALLNLVAQALDDNRETIFQKIIVALQGLLRDVRQDPRHPVRRKFDAALRQFIDRLQHAPEVMAKAEALKEQVLAHPVIDELAASLWDGVRRAAVRYRTHPDDPSREALERGIAAAGESLLGNEALLHDLDRFVTSVVATVVEEHRHEAAELIARTVSGWDPDVAVRRLELAVGSDLQFIRINGTLVGGLVGLLIHTVSVLLR